MRLPEPQKMKLPEKETSQLLVEVPTETLNKFKFICVMRRISQKEMINNYINIVIEKIWTPEIDKIYTTGEQCKK